MAQQRRSIASEQVRAQEKIQADAAAYRDQAHQERGGEAMPDGKTVLRNIWADHGAHRGFEQRPHGDGRNDANEKACEHEKLGRKAHEEGRLAWRARKLPRRRTKEDFAYEAQRVRDRKHARDRNDVRQRLIYERVIMNLYGLREEHLLREKAVEQRDAGHSSGGNHRQSRRDRHEPPKATQPTHVARAGFVIDDSRRHEQ